MNNLLEISNSIDGTLEIGKRIAGSLKEDILNIFLCGELGAGKTTLLKGLGEGLGIKDENEQR